MDNPKRWRPSPTIQISIALHLGMAVALLVRPSLWPWWLGALFVNHLILTAAGLWPRSNLLGHNTLRLPAAAIVRNEIAITIDDGPDPDTTPDVLDLLDRHRAHASFFVIGNHAAKYPDLVSEIVRRGHSVENHSQHHSHWFAFYGLYRLRREISEAQATLHRISGDRPQFFRAPAGLRNPLLDFVLHRLSLHYVAWTRRGFDTVATDAQKVLQRLKHNLDAGDILLLHDGNAAKTRSGQAVICEVLPSLLEQAESAGLKPVTLRAAMLP